MFYSRFLKNHSTDLAPLNNLLKKDIPWRWTKTEEEAFVKAKELLLNSQTLVHYDDSSPLHLACDASSYGAGAVLSHCIDGQYCPIAFASRILTQAHRNDSQLDKEASSDFIKHGDISNVTSEMIKKKTAVDPLLSRVYRYTLSGWPIMVDPERVPFKNKKDELTLEQGCLLSIWGTLVVIPTSLQKEVLKELHETHPGITKMNALARFYVLWPKIDVDFERMAERVVQILKTALKQALLTGTNVDTVLARYRDTLYSTTGESPAMLLMGRRLRTPLDLLTPSVHKHVEAKQHARVERTSDRQLRNLQVGDQVIVRNYSERG
ncbi:uncharacterized protein [Montipora capricornis]|uniref:uncharacterized protein n=1 Tax=Montipora capricornis TaxID=246305 RepID=UPI0035F172C3